MNITLDNKPILQQNQEVSTLEQLLACVSENPQDYVQDEALREVVRTIYHAKVDRETKRQLIKNFIEILGKNAWACETIARVFEALDARITHEQNPYEQEKEVAVNAETQELPLAA